MSNNSYLDITQFEKLNAKQKKSYLNHEANHGRMTNMKKTLLQNVPAFTTYMEWYTLKDLIVPFIGNRAMSLFSYSISEGNNCLICSTFFRKILIDSGDDPDNPILNETEKLLMDLGQKIAQDPHNIPEEYYVKLKTLFTQEQIVLLFSFAGIMNATNLFNIIGKVPLDEILYEYTKENKK